MICWGRGFAAKFLDWAAQKRGSISAFNLLSFASLKPLRESDSLQVADENKRARLGSALREHAN